MPLLEHQDHMLHMYASDIGSVYVLYKSVFYTFMLRIVQVFEIHGGNKYKLYNLNSAFSLDLPHKKYSRCTILLCVYCILEVYGEIDVQVSLNAD